MRTLFLSLALLIARGASPALAQPPGVNLSWDDCNVSVGGGLNKTSTCQSNTEAAKRCFGTYVLPADADGITGNNLVMDIVTNSATLPCWWNFTIAARSTAYDVRFDAPCPDVNQAGIFNYWATTPGGATGTFSAALMPSAAVPRIRVTAMAFVDGAQAQPVAASVGEIYSFTFVLKHDATVGGTCNGCLLPACFVLQGIRVFQVGSPTMELFNPSTRNFVFWQGGAVQAPGCQYTPVMNRTWGSVRALYR